MLPILKLLAATAALIQVLVLVPGFIHPTSEAPRGEHRFALSTTPVLASQISDTTLVRGHLHIDRLGRIWTT